MRTSKLVTISLLPELLDEAEKLAKAEKRTRSEFFREAIRRYIEEKKWERIYRYGRMKAQEQGLAEADVERLVDEYRAEQMNVKSGD
ncbi:MAG: ribbon-helix-helix domain-containing protein [Deltaproteobacteria bacterium]|jgi:metal-responsive CopG/Arc/MetJ family transcriptional regulator|nr:ribbon-helix-helix domain-containing protein [Deltaproteobacteria bacterium]